jgi:hypothetical protein
MRLRERPCIVLALVAIAGCDRAAPKLGQPVPNADAGAVASYAAPAAPNGASASVTSDAAAATGACTPDSKGGVVIPDSARATRIRIAAVGSKALVTFWEAKKRGGGGPDLESTFGYLFDASAAALGPKTKLEENDMGDEPVSAGAPVALAGDVFAISCEWAAPAGTYACKRTKPGEKPAPLFAFSGIVNGGPEKPDIAAVVKGEDALVVVPVGNNLQLFSARVSARTKTSPFAIGANNDAMPDALDAALSADDEATVVYRQKGAIKARRAGFDQKWRGGTIDLSAKGALVGAPVVASEPGHVVTLFSQRAKASDPWKVVVAEPSPTGEVKRSELATGAQQAQGPGIAKGAAPGCFHVSWVEGTGTTTRTKLAHACNGAIDPSSLTTLSSDGVEGGRAYLATDPGNPTAVFAVWQEIPKGEGSELRVAKLTCKRSTER